MTDAFTDFLCQIQAYHLPFAKMVLYDAKEDQATTIKAVLKFSSVINQLIGVA